MTYQKDERLEKVEQITIDFEVFKKTLARNYLGEKPSNWGVTYVLRLFPPFKEEMEVEYFPSENGVHYDSNWNEKPFHIPPELLILEGNGGNFYDIVNYPEEWQIRQTLSGEEIEEEGGIEKCMENTKEMFWDELKTILPKTFNLGNVHGIGSYEVEINWVNL